MRAANEPLSDIERDLDGIFVYWAERVSIDVADRLIDAITGVRSFPAGNYVVYYRKIRRGIEILHVFHGKQDQVSEHVAEECTMSVKLALATP